MLTRIAKRIKEPSTWAGLAAVLATLASVVPSIATNIVPMLVADKDLAQAIVAFLASAAGLTAIVLKEKHSVLVVSDTTDDIASTDHIL